MVSVGLCWGYELGGLLCNRLDSNCTFVSESPFSTPIGEWRRGRLAFRDPCCWESCQLLALLGLETRLF